MLQIKLKWYICVLRSHIILWMYEYLYLKVLIEFLLAVADPSGEEIPPPLHNNKKGKI